MSPPARPAEPLVDSGVAWAESLHVRSWRCEPPPTGIPAFHASIPGYAPTTLHDVLPLADELGVGRVLVKEESHRFGLPAFKVLGVSWAVARVVLERADAAGSAAAGGPEAGGGRGGARADVVGSVAADGSESHQVGAVTWDRVVAAAATVGGLTLATATDGNHGRALARVARLLGLSARVHVPAVMAPGPAAAIAAEGADVVRIDGSYDEAVATAARDADADDDVVLVQDTAWPGYERVPGWIVEGYSSLAAEVDEQVADLGLVGIDLTVVPTGVGSLAQAVVTWNRSRPPRPGGRHRAVVAAEPETAACVVASLRADQLLSVATEATVMAGLNCGTPSSLAWPVLRAGLDGAVAVTDGAATAAVEDLGALGIDAGPSGAASLAAARALLHGPGATARRAHLALPDDAVVVLLSTEGRAGAQP